MKGAVLILRAQPAADETAARARARDLEPVVAPLFTIQPMAWTPPPTEGVDAVLFTSANAPRHAGEGLRAFLHLPCYAVGEATALAAGEAGFSDVRIGPSDGDAVVRMMAGDGIRRAFHPTTLDPAPLAPGPVELDQVAVYLAVAQDRLSDVAIAALNAGAVVLLHSPRMAATFSALAGDRRRKTRIAAISDNAAAAADDGWAGVAVANEPRDEALLNAAERLWGTERPSASPAPPPAHPDGDPPPLETVQPRRRSWPAVLLLFLIAFFLGVVALVWLLTRWDGAAELLGIVPEPPPAATTQSPPQPLPRNATPPPAPRSDGETIVIDPDVARRVAALEQRIGELGLEARSAVGNADRAEGLLVAFAVRRALDRGVGLGYLEGLLRQRFGDTQPEAVGTILSAARQPATLQELQAGLQAVEADLISAAPGASWMDRLRSEFANLIVIRREGTPSVDPGARLTRALRRIEAGQVDVALAEVLRMPGAANAQQWIDAAQLYVAARRALDTIELAALLEPRMPPQQQPAAPPPPAAQ